MIEQAIRHGSPRHARDRTEARGTALDRWWALIISTPLRARLWAWGGPFSVTLLASWLRLVHLDHPHTLVFDETFYVKDAFTLLRNGYESTWPADADDRFNRGETDIYRSDPSYVVHPPLGKWVIALGLALCGPGSPFGWRIATAVVGIMAVVLLMVVVHRMTRSTLLVVTAGLLFAIDGNAIVMSRVGLLDNTLMLFALAGFLAIVCDRQWMRSRMSERVFASRWRESVSPWGPLLLWRPWILVAGVMFGAGAAVKWSGLFFLVVFGLYLVVTDMLLRRRLGIAFWASSAILRQGPVSFLLFIPIAVVTYLASWTGWIVTSGGMYRNWVEAGGERVSGAFSWLPSWLQNLWHYHASALDYHVGLTTAHPYQANPWTWPLMLRPTNMFFHANVEGENGCTSSDCVEQITGLGNPLTWWAATAAILYLAYRCIRYRASTRVGVSVLALLGFAAGYVPWLLVGGRTIFQFYSIVFEPYMIIALVFVLGTILGSRDDPWRRRAQGIAFFAVFMAVACLVSAFFWPLWTGEQIPFWYWQAHIWLPGWR